MALSAQDIIAALRGIVGDAGVFDTPSDMAGYLSEPRKRFSTPATAVVRPRTVTELQTLVAWANDNQVSLIPQSGNTGLVGGQVPLNGDEVIVSLTGLTATRSIDTVAGNIVVEAGVTLQDAQKIAEDAGMLLPLSLASEGTARIGGVLSTNAGGVQVLAYGNARAMCLGIEAVLPDGRLYAGLNALAKDNTGYDLRDLFIGAEGTLGFITAAVLKTYPLPEAHETALAAVAGPQEALELFTLMRTRAGTTLTAFELLPRFGIDLQIKHGVLPRDPSAGESPWYVLTEISRPVGGREGVLVSALEAALERGLIGDATVVADSLANRELLWKMREQMSDVQSLEGASIKHDVSVPVAHVPQLLADGIAAIAAIDPTIRPCPFGHLGDGNIHFNFSQPEGADAAAFMAGADSVHAAIYDVVTRLGGSISAEHGIGQLKTKLLAEVKDPVALDMMWRIKQTLDPNGIMNPGKVLG